jgi:hypothetical protein
MSCAAFESRRSGDGLARDLITRDLNGVRQANAAWEYLQNAIAPQRIARCDLVFKLRNSQHDLNRCLRNLRHQEIFQDEYKSLAQTFEFFNPATRDGAPEHKTSYNIEEDIYADIIPVSATTRREEFSQAGCQDSYTFHNKSSTWRLVQ